MRKEALFDLVLSYPQWQGSGLPKDLTRGAEAAAQACGRYGPVVNVADAGEGEHENGVQRWTAIREQFRSAQSLLRERQPERLLTAGGDCACDIAAIDYLHRRYPDLMVIWVDAHLDANTPETSPSGHFHGMPVGAVLGSPPADLLPLLGSPLSPQSFRYVSAHVGDEGDWSFQAQHQLEWLGPDERISGPIHVHFDLDALDPSEFPHLAYTDGRLSMAAGVELMQRLSASGTIVGLTITEFSPVDDDAAKDGCRYIDRLCRAALG